LKFNAWYETGVTKFPSSSSSNNGLKEFHGLGADIIFPSIRTRLPGINKKFSPFKKAIDLVSKFRISAMK
jgi:hypothetical protein